MSAQRRPTVTDVAARAGVSAKTVSNVLTGAFHVKPETRDRVESAMRELQYVPNLSARGLRNGRKAEGRLVEGQVTNGWKAALGGLALAYPDRINNKIN